MRQTANLALHVLHRAPQTDSPSVMSAEDVDYAGVGVAVLDGLGPREAAAATAFRGSFEVVLIGTTPPVRAAAIPVSPTQKVLVAFLAPQPGCPFRLLDSQHVLAPDGSCRRAGLFAAIDDAAQTLTLCAAVAGRVHTLGVARGMNYLVATQSLRSEKK